jgi:hypothetical protein
MTFKVNINQIHFDLNEKFESVKIEEKSSNKFGNFFKITVNDKVPFIIPFKNLDTNGNFTWFYPSDPSNESSHLVEGNSNSAEFPNLVLDIIQNNRFSESYKNISK